MELQINKTKESIIETTILFIQYSLPHILFEYLTIFSRDLSRKKRQTIKAFDRSLKMNLFVCRISGKHFPDGVLPLNISVPHGLRFY